MKSINSIRLKNFKRFQKYEVSFYENINILIGDNEAGKSTILAAIDLCISASRSKIEIHGIENIFNQRSIHEFFSNGKIYSELPVMEIEIFISGIDDEFFNGKNNSYSALKDGMRLRCSPDEVLIKEIKEILAEPENHFPFEYYKIDFETFSGNTYFGNKRPLKYVMIDTAISNNEYAHKEYTRNMYECSLEGNEKAKHSFLYRSTKENFSNGVLKELNDRVEYKFGLKNNSKSNFESDLTILDNNIPIEYKGKGQQCFVKANFALNKRKNGHDVVLIEEPENHLSHSKMKCLISEIDSTKYRQLIITTHNPLICARLDLRKVQILSGKNDKPVVLNDIPEDVADFFIKAPDNNLLEFILSEKCILVEGDAEYILMESFFEKETGKKPHECGVAIISVNGTGFKNYMQVAKATKAKVAVIRDNDKNLKENCQERYKEYITNSIQVFSDLSNDRYTFEVCVYQDNIDICEELFAKGRKTLSVLEYMISNKTDAAYELLKKKSKDIVVPKYLKDAIKWINA